MASKHKKKFGIEFEGFDEMFGKYEALGGSLKDLAQECLEFIPEMIHPSLHEHMKKHHRSGQTERSIVDGQQPIYWEGTRAYIDVGFHISKGGLASIFLMYGTPKHAPANQYDKAKGVNKGMTADKNLYNDIFGTSIRRKIDDMQKEICDRKIQEIMGK